MACCVCREWKSTNPVFPVKLFWKRPVFGLSSLASLINYGTNFGMNYMLSLYLQVGMGFSTRSAGLILVISPGVQAMVSMVVGKVSGARGAGGTVGPRLLSAAGMLGTAAVAS